MNSDPQVSHYAQVSVTQLNLEQGHSRESCVAMETALPSERTFQSVSRTLNKQQKFSRQMNLISNRQNILEVVSGAFSTSRRFVRKVRWQSTFLPWVHRHFWGGRSVLARGTAGGTAGDGAAQLLPPGGFRHQETRTSRPQGQLCLCRKVPRRS